MVHRVREKHLWLGKDNILLIDDNNQLFIFVDK